MSSFFYNKSSPTTAHFESSSGSPYIKGSSLPLSAALFLLQHQSFLLRAFLSPVPQFILALSRSSPCARRVMPSPPPTATAMQTEMELRTAPPTALMVEIPRLSSSAHNCLFNCSPSWIHRPRNQAEPPRSPIEPIPARGRFPEQCIELQDH
jgi:hypothetical protein